VTDAISLFLPRESAIHRLHPLTKLALAGCGLVGGLALPGVWAGYLVFVAFLLPLAVWARIARQYLRTTLRAVLPFAVSLFLIQGFLWPGGTPILHIGPISLKAEGVLFAVRSTGRILAVGGSFLLLTFTTRPDWLMQALSERGTPKTLAYMILTTIQIVPRFRAKANTILDAQRSRGLETETTFWRRLRTLVPLIQPLVLGSIVDVEERAIALETRAFGRRCEKSYLVELTDSRLQAAVRWLLLLLAVAMVVTRLFRLW
jgi:energy-coupling factor transport system permease protein